MSPGVLSRHICMCCVILVLLIEAPASPNISELYKLSSDTYLNIKRYFQANFNSSDLCFSGILYLAHFTCFYYLAVKPNLADNYNVESCCSCRRLRLLQPSYLKSRGTTLCFSNKPAVFCNQSVILTWTMASSQASSLAGSRATIQCAWTTL